MNTRKSNNFLEILNDLKRRPLDAASELGISEQEIHEYLNGHSQMPQELLEKACKIWPIQMRDFYPFIDDSNDGVTIMRAESSYASRRIMSRGKFDYYEYRDTAMDRSSLFRPEWILELCEVEDNKPENPMVQWNNGHFLHQFTYFIGPVNFYYKDSAGNKCVETMNTGDSMYISPFVPHTFTTRKNKASIKGLILAITYGNKLSGENKQEASITTPKCLEKFFLNLSNEKSAFASLIEFHMECASVGTQELSRRSLIKVENLLEFLQSKSLPSFDEISSLANSLNISIRDLIPPKAQPNQVIIFKSNQGRKWKYPEENPSYEIQELAFFEGLPFSKSFVFNIFSKNDNKDLNLNSGLQQYCYNVGQRSFLFTWEHNNKKMEAVINPNDSFYVKPFVKHSFTNLENDLTSLLVMRIGGRLVGEPQFEMSYIGKEYLKQIQGDNKQWFNPEGRTTI